MNKQQSYKNGGGKLYLVPTPIGNLDDMTYRAIKVLSDVDLIASEDTRNTQKLLNHFEIETKQISLHEHNFRERIPILLEKLQAGESIAQVSDAGMPSISDPGHELVLAAIDNNIAVIALPGPTAGVTALIASGLTAQPFTFYGFLPRKEQAAKKVLENYRSNAGSLILYESPYRIVKTLQWCQDVFGPDNAIVLARELTKIHEEYLRGSIAEILATLADTNIKGELCLMIECGQEERGAKLDTDLSLKEQVEYHIAQGKDSKTAIKEVAKQNKLKKQIVYQAYHID